MSSAGYYDHGVPARVYDLPPSTEPQPARLKRRHFVGGLAVMTTALAGCVSQFAPEWGAGAPSRPASVQQEAAVAPAPAPPRLIQYPAIFHQEWQAFRARYVNSEGRVLDTGNGNASHSEGQGWGLMAAQAADDPEMFATILSWTAHNLQRRNGDALHAWRYRPSDPNPVSDLNNATDGDLFIAAALARAAVRWNRPDYAAAAARIGHDILGLVRHAGARALLLPAASGFEKPDCVTVNPSYYAFALFPDIAAVAPSPLWDELRQSGLAMVLQARFGRWMLPPDWLQVDRKSGALSVSLGWPTRFSYDAIRVPLHLAWANLPAAPALDSFRQYWLTAHAVPPAWVDLRTQETANYPAPPGFVAVAAVAMRSAAPERGLAIPLVSTAKDYYSAGLILLSRLAAGESGLMA